MKKHFYILSLSLILAIMSFSFSALATQRYVSPSGSDVIGNGSSSAPWLTIQHAVDNSVAGDVINLDEGTYVSSNVTVDKGLTIQGYNSIYIGYSPYAMRNRVFIVPAAEDGNVDNAFGNSAQNAFIIKSNGVTIKNLTINGRGNPLLTPGKNNFRAGIVTLDASQTGGGTWNNLLVSDVYIKYTWRRGISVYPYDVTGTIITGTRVDNVAYNQAMYLAGQSQAINDTVYNCFQGIVQNPNTTTPSGLIKATGNVFNGISNFPGCWGDLGGGNYSGQPRGLEFNNTLSPARTITYNHNTFTAFGDAAVGIYTVRADGNSQVDSNSVSFTSNGAQGLLIGWAYANGFSVSNNTVSVTGSSRGIYIFGSGTVAIPMLLENNILTGTGSTYSGPGEGTGIVITNLYLNGPDLDPSYVIIQNNNSITGFTRGIDLINNAGGGSPPELILTAQDNTIYGNSAYGLSNNTGVWVIATNNWWGTCTGPYNATLNPTGTGNAVTGFVSINPWKSLPEGAGGITGPIIAYQGQNGIAYSVPSILYATTYTWTLPTGASINTGAGTKNITVNFSGSASSGYISVQGTNTCGSGTISQKYIQVNPPLPANLNVNTVDITNGQVFCYNATNTVTVAGGATTFTIEPGGSVTIIAGVKIDFLPGAHVKSGGYMDAYITTDGTYCGQQKTLPSANDSTPAENLSASTGFFKAYPNPASNKVTIELNQGEKVNNAVIQVYSMMGKHELQQPMNGRMSTELFVGDLPAGIYLIMVKKDDKTGTVKVIKL